MDPNLLSSCKGLVYCCYIVVCLLCVYFAVLVMDTLRLPPPRNRLTVRYVKA